MDKPTSEKIWNIIKMNPNKIWSSHEVQELIPDCPPIGSMITGFISLQKQNKIIMIDFDENTKISYYKVVI